MSVYPEKDIRQDEDDIPIGRWMRIWRHVGLAHRQPDRLRLLSDIERKQAWVNQHKPADAVSQKPDDWPKFWYVECDALLKKARAKAVQGDVSGGYENLHTVEREAVSGMSEEERAVEAKALRVEVKKKLSADWRGTVIMHLLGEEKPCAEIPEGEGTEGEKTTVAVSVAALAEAIHHRNTHDRNMHRKMDKVRWQLAWLGLFIGALVLTAIVVGIWLRNATLPAGDLALLPFCIYLGLLGGLMSSAMSAKGTDRNARTPEIGVEFYALVARSLLGAAASIPVYIAGLEGIVTVGGTEHSKTWGLLLLCFIAGFSERWFRGTVAAVSGGNQEKSVDPGKASK
ncbi:hypothetical protein [Caballeronia sp. M23-90]